MSLISPTRKNDMELLAEWADIIESVYRFYMKKPNKEVKEYLDSFIETYTQLKHKVDTKDYTEDDASYWKLEELFKGIKLSPEPNN